MIQRLWFKHHHLNIIHIDSWQPAAKRGGGDFWMRTLSWIMRSVLTGNSDLVIQLWQCRTVFNWVSFSPEVADIEEDSEQLTSGFDPLKMSGGESWLLAGEDLESNWWYSNNPFDALVKWQNWILEIKILIF